MTRQNQFEICNLTYIRMAVDILANHTLSAYVKNHVANEDRGLVFGNTKQGE